MEIEVKAGNQLRAKLATTVSFENLFTELVKNSLQNNATEVKIIYNNDRASILDNGDGFDHVKDDSGMNEFEKYFVFGNSYTKSDKSLNLGQMGIGGKAANDRLSDINNTHWTISTKNKRNKSFLLTFKSKDEKFLADLKPQLNEIPAGQTEVPYNTGAKITIHNLNSQIKEAGWPHQEIKDNLQLFFNMLYFQTKDANKPFRLWVNNQEIKFNNQLPGKPWFHQDVEFDYIINGETKKSKYTAKLNIVEPNEKSLLSSVDLVSYTRVGRVNVHGGTTKDLDFDTLFKFTSTQDVMHFWNTRIRGYIICNDVSDVKDNNGLGAKDLSHHRLQWNHPITKPLIVSIHNVIVKRVFQLLNTQSDPVIKQNNIIKHVNNIICSTFNIPDAFLIKKTNEIKITK